ncbi:MAG: malonyl-CoA decarboxylase [Gammaproteobacteria bacterium]|jgi:malonyl-CoA decarboxylase|nr:malonyl-CoA decarboxylase [Gammaproteobacteria bacterium]
MAFGRFQDFLSGLVKRQRGLFFAGSEEASIAELLDKLMGTVGEVSGIVTARQVLDHYNELEDEQKLEFFQNLEQNFNANQAVVKLAFETYEQDPSSANLNNLSKAAEPLRHEVLRRLNSTPDATHDLVAMRTDLLKLLRDHPELRAVNEDFIRLFSSWFGRAFLILETINWSTSGAILERIIRYEAVHEIKDWDDLRSRIDPPNRRCFAYFHPALIDEPLIFVEVALLKDVPGSINSILEDEESEVVDPSEYNTAVFYGISNCQPGLKSITFGNFLIKQVVQELQSEFSSIKTFVTLSPIPGLQKWLNTESSDELPELGELKDQVDALPASEEAAEEHEDLIRKLAVNYLLQAKRGKFPADPVARFHLGNGASLHQLHTGADFSEKGLSQSRGAMVNYLYDIRDIETNHEHYATNGDIVFNDKLKSLLVKA